MSAKICNVCNTRRVYTGSKGGEIAPSLSEMCNYCFEEGGWENTHSDASHDDILTIPAADRSTEQLSEINGCWICYPELNLAQKPTTKAASTTPKAQGTRRPQLNHKGHSHPATPAARRACKALFWAEMAKSGVTPANVTESAFVGWDANLDGHGKPKPVPAPAKLTVVPRGPKGGVINQMKKGNPAK